MSERAASGFDEANALAVAIVRRHNAEGLVQRQRLRPAFRRLRNHRKLDKPRDDARENIGAARTLKQRTHKRMAVDRQPRDRTNPPPAALKTRRLCEGIGAGFST